MEDNHKTTVISRSKNGYLSQCSCCGEINFLYKNIALRFDNRHFEIMKRHFIRCCEVQDNYRTLHGKSVLIKSPVQDLCFCFNKKELKDIASLFIEAGLIIEARKVLY